MDSDGKFYFLKSCWKEGSLLGQLMYMICLIFLGLLLGIKKIMFIGLFQAFAIFPGISRSGMTISSGILMGINKKKTVEFSFLLSIPVILGANIFQFLEIISSSVKSSDWGNLFLIFFVSMIISLITINFTLKWAQKIKFWLFGFYGVVFGLFTLALQLV